MIDDTGITGDLSTTNSFEERQDQLPPEVATLLILIGIVGIPLPGPGIPFILAGGLSIWPKTFGPIDDRFRQSCPKSHRQVRNILNRFESDLNRRYPKN